MDITLPAAKINGNVVHGQAHIQPGINNWIGVCIIPDRLLEINDEQWKSVVLDYEGIFNCGKESINGKSKAKILHISPDISKDNLVITLEGIEEPELDRKIGKDLRFGYNENLPVYMNVKGKEKGKDKSF